jgi:two-component system, NtrC family, nitrogen regulation sensor histidine kinase NtrY
MNAVEANESTANPVIHLKGFRMEDNRPVISVRDKGSGIVTEYLEKVFIPYFTTKPKGTGIGLSIARRVMQLHRGSISVLSNPLNGSEFLLKL